MKKDIYFFWEGGHLPFLEYISIISCKHKNPDWRILLINKVSRGVCRWPTGEHKRNRRLGKNYMPELVSAGVCTLDFEKEFADVANVDKNMAFVHAKDLVNWYVLANRGGAVCDTDIIFLQSMNDMHGAMQGSGAKIGLISFENYPKADYMPVSFMMGDRSEFFNEVYRNAVRTYNPREYECAGTASIPYKNLDRIRDKYGSEVYRIGENSFFPFTHVNFVDSIGMIYKENSRQRITDETVGVHWYGGNLDNDYDETSYNKYNNTLCMLIGEVICQNHNNQSAEPT